MQLYKKFYIVPFSHRMISILYSTGSSTLLKMTGTFSLLELNCILIFVYTIFKKILCSHWQTLRQITCLCYHISCCNECEYLRNSISHTYFISCGITGSYGRLSNFLSYLCTLFHKGYKTTVFSLVVWEFLSSVSWPTFIFPSCR